MNTANGDHNLSWVSLTLNPTPTVQDTSHKIGPFLGSTTMFGKQDRNCL